MRQGLVLGCGLAGAVLLVGCGQSDDSVVRDQIQVMNQLAEICDKITDKASAEAVAEEIKKINERAAELDKRVRAWPKEKQETFAKKYQTQMQEARIKLEAALWTGRSAFRGGPKTKWVQIYMNGA